jgi:signal transduction histidine kinase
MRYQWGGLDTALTMPPVTMTALIRRTVGRLRLPQLSPFVVDVVLSAAVTVATVLPVLLPPRQWWIVVLAMLASVPLLWRRRAPIPVAVVVGLAITGLLVVQPPLPIELPYGTLVCAYTIAAYCTPRWRRLTVVFGGAGVLVSLLIPAQGIEGYGFAAMSFVTAWAIGTGVRARRSEIDALRERAHRLEEERAAAVDRERIMLARDMHDIVTHSVGLMTVQAEAGAAVVRRDSARAEVALQVIADTGRDTVAQLRRLLVALRSGSDSLTHQPGLDSLPELVAGTERAGLRATLTESGDPRPVRAEVGVAVYRVVQEALSNTLRHAAATAVRVSLNWSDSALTVEVVDDGRGPASQANQAGGAGFGLLGMGERAATCGGNLHTGPGEDGGFAVTLHVPVTLPIQGEARVG